MAILKASEKLKILALGKATLKEINELEAMAEKEQPDEPKPEPTPKPTPEPKPDEPKPDEPTPDEPTPEPQPDEKDIRIAELEKQISDMQQQNVNQDNSGSVENSETALLDIFKSFR